MALALNPYRKRITALIVFRNMLQGLALGAWTGGILLLWDYFAALPIPTWLPYGFPILGLIVGLGWSLRRIPSDAAIAQSLDRRMGLDDQVTSARELADTGSIFDPLLHEAAQSAIAAAPADRAFPFRWSASYSHAAIAAIALIVIGFLVLQQPWVNQGERQKRQALKGATAEVERIQKEIAQQPQSTPESEAMAKAAASDLEKLQRQLERERLSPKEAEAKAMKIANELDALEKSRRESHIAEANKLEAMGKQLLEAKAKEMALSQPANQDPLNPDPGAKAQEEARAQQLEDQIAQKRRELQNQDLTPAERRKLEAEMANLQKELDTLRQLDAMRRESEALQNQMDSLRAEQKSLEQKLQDKSLSESERKALEKQLEENKAAQKENAKRQEELKKQAEMAQQIQKAMEELSKNEAFQEMQRLMQEMMQRAQEQQQANEGQGAPPQPLTEEELKAMLEQIQQLKEMLEDEELAKQMLEQMKEMLESGEFQAMASQLSNAMGFG